MMGVDMPTKEVKSKTKNLRATYSQELTKIDKSNLKKIDKFLTCSHFGYCNNTSLK